MNLKLENITLNEKDKITTCVFNIEGHKIVKMIKCCKDDDFDKYIGVALAFAELTFGSKTKFHKFVDETAKVVK